MNILRIDESVSSFLHCEVPKTSCDNLILPIDDSVSSFLYHEFNKTSCDNLMFGQWLDERFHCHMVYRGDEYWPSSLKFKSKNDLSWFILQLPIK